MQSGTKDLVDKNNKVIGYIDVSGAQTLFSLIGYVHDDCVRNVNCELITSDRRIGAVCEFCSDTSFHRNLRGRESYLKSNSSVDTTK